MTAFAAISPQLLVGTGNTLAVAGVFEKVELQGFDGVPAPSEGRAANTWRFNRVGLWRVTVTLILLGNGAVRTAVRLRGAETLRIDDNVATNVGEAHSIRASWMVPVTVPDADQWLEWTQIGAAGGQIQPGDDTRVELEWLAPLGAVAKGFR